MIDASRQIMASLQETGSEGDLDVSGVISALTTALKAATPEPAPKVDEHAAVASDPAPPNTLLGEILVEAGVAQAEVVADALQQQEQGDSRHIGEILVQNGTVEPEVVHDALQVQTERREDAVNSNIRVDVNLLDKVMNLVGELVLARNQILQFTSNQKDPIFLSTAQRLNLITTELQEGVMKTRMQPIGNIWNKFPRIIRDLSNSCGKLVRIEMEGTSTELDKTIIEAIKDPLTHIVRNSIDHGIEMPAEREAAGKPAQGLLFLRAFHEGGQVNIEIADDGAGIDLDAVKAKAVDKGLVSPQHAAKMNDREVANLVFLPGFSTAKKVTNISGRGVGMDVVKTNIEKIGGTVDILSVRGGGTTLKIKIPLTLAIIPALIVTSGSERFAIPQVSLVELVRLEGNASKGIEMIQNAAVYRLRGNLLPVIYLNRELQLRELQVANAEQVINIVVLQADGRQFGLVVDDINDTEEIVVKPLGKQLKGISSFAGATIMGDGQVALILDVMGLAQRACLAAGARDYSAASAKSAATAAASNQESWLLFRVGEKGRLAVPLSMVSRLEEFDPSVVETSSNRQVVQYRGEIMPLVRVSEALELPLTAAQEGPIQVVVHSESGRSFGLVVDEILDIVDQHVTVANKTSNRHLLGSAVIQQHVTDLVNVSELVTACANSGRVA
jgi:two-component system chemotaxis sensor kinase CheA